VGLGATFTITLPVASPKGETARPMTADAELARLDGVRVLVLDDEADLRLLLCEVLGRLGAIVEAVARAEEALAKVSAFRPDVLVSDIGMPGTDGHAFIRKVRALPPELGGETPAIALTAYARPDDSGRAVAAGFQVHVGKPVDPAELVRVVAGLHKRPRSPS